MTEPGDRTGPCLNARHAQFAPVGLAGVAGNKHETHKKPKPVLPVPALTGTRMMIQWLLQSQHIRKMS